MWEAFCYKEQQFAVVSLITEIIELHVEIRETEISV